MPTPERRQSSLRRPAPLTEVPAGGEALRRRVYLWATGLGGLILLLLWVLQLRRPAPDLFALYGYPVLLLECLWGLFWLLGHRSLLVAERATFLLNALAVLAQLFLAVLTGDGQALTLSGNAYWLLVAVSILSYLMFSARQGVWLSAGFYTLGVVLPWVALGLRGQPLPGAADLLRVQLSCGAILVLLYSLAWYRERFLLERGHRLTLEQLVNTDPLTHLPNRRALYAAIERLLEEVRQGTPGCLILLDLDHFKRINDTFGHNAGDGVLLESARLLRSALRDSDDLGRWGGEEYLIALPGVTPEQGRQIAGRLRDRLAAHVFPGVGQVTASFGVTPCTPHDDLGSSMARADLALYAAKAAGRNQVALREANLMQENPVQES
ncbi:putative diguanylate cyclase DgcC [Deinococcus carri]|uniref:Diguanylate cyclase DgcC n=1 Tax=Deinococcus carri TaxID=1211323 RepID=A0ABP9W616_9DEIO